LGIRKFLPVATTFQDDLDRVLAGESVFGPKMSKNSKIMDSQRFEDFPKEKSRESLIDDIAQALEKNIKASCESGHNVIFASIASHHRHLRLWRNLPNVADALGPELFLEFSP